MHLVKSEYSYATLAYAVSRLAATSSGDVLKDSTASQEALKSCKGNADDFFGGMKFFIMQNIQLSSSGSSTWMWYISCCFSYVPSVRGTGICIWILWGIFCPGWPSMIMWIMQNGESYTVPGWYDATRKYSSKCLHRICRWQLCCEINCWIV